MQPLPWDDSEAVLCESNVTACYMGETPYSFTPVCECNSPIALIDFDRLIYGYRLAPSTLLEEP